MTVAIKIYQLLRIPRRILCYANYDGMHNQEQSSWHHPRIVGNFLSAGENPVAQIDSPVAPARQQQKHRSSVPTVAVMQGEPVG
jgi:hypothetical protein